MALFRNLTPEQQEALGLRNIDVPISKISSEETLLSLISVVGKDATLLEILESLSDLNNTSSESSESIKTNNTINSNRSYVVLSNILEELKTTNKLLAKIYSPE